MGYSLLGNNVLKDHSQPPLILWNTFGDREFGAPGKEEDSMPSIVYFVVISILRGVTEGVKRIRAKRKQNGLCAGCAFVHMQYGATGRNSVFCTFGGGVRQV